MKNIIFTIVFIFFLTSFCLAKTQQEEYKNDYLYSEAYFDYIIEQASIDRELENERKKEEEKKKKEEEAICLEETLNNKEEVIQETAQIEDFDAITFEDTPFKIKISENIVHPAYKESYKKVDTKSTIRLNDKFNFYQDTIKTRNKYNSNDYRIVAGSEINITSYFNIITGLETNYRGLDQNPQSRKVYFNPTINIADKIYLSFINKYNPYTRSTDHDISFRVSPLKSKAFDFGIYSGITNNENGTHSESVSFSTNFYFK